MLSEKTSPGIRKQSVWLAAIAFLLGLMIASCSAPPATPTAANIVVGTDATVPPFENFNPQTQKFEGMDIDIMNAVAASQNFKVEYKTVPFGRLMTDMAQGKYDAAISSIIINDEHKKDMLFSNPYFAAGPVIVINLDNTTITGRDTLSGQVGVVASTTGEIEVKKIKSVTAVPYDKLSQAFLDLVTDQISAIVCNNPAALQYIGNNPDKFKIVGKPLTDENFGIAVARGKTDLLNQINAGLKAVKSEGLIDRAAEKWLK
jgi:polar amino acid transport system substrate-binding protein